MLVMRTIDELRSWRGRTPASLGLVPTMGALHEGHLALVRRAREQNDQTAVSIFVNPRQFGDPADLAGYPRTLERDLALLEAEAVDAVFVPAVEEMYPAKSRTTIQVAELSELLEGDSRPGHFDGVCLIVCKLLNLFQPDRAYFGQKDYQQLLVVQQMARDLNINAEIVAVETVRDLHGLAISSRNVFLSDRQMLAARRIPEALVLACNQFNEGERAAERLEALVYNQLIEDSSLAIEYVTLREAKTLELMEKVDRPAVLLVAVSCGDTRLIDNTLLG